MKLTEGHIFEGKLLIPSFSRQAIMTCTCSQYIVMLHLWIGLNFHNYLSKFHSFCVFVQMDDGQDYSLTVEFFVSPFLVREWEVADNNGTKKETLRLDLVGESADHYKGADIIIFNTGHWWTHYKTSEG